ncbi:MAG: CotH kinase family protein [Alistipes sp.]|nr:CotH kinase family protein [Alistipes sp.]
MNLSKITASALRTKLMALLALVFMFTMAACSGGGDEPAPEPKPSPDNTLVTIEGSSITIPEGGSASVVFKVTPTSTTISSNKVKICDASTKKDIPQISYDKSKVASLGSGRYKVTISATTEEEFRANAVVIVSTAEGKTYTSNTFVIRNTVAVSELSSISFLKKHNPQLKSDIVCHFAKESNRFSARIHQIAPTMVDHSKLIATFTTEGGSKVTVNGVEQKSGVTVNDFTEPVTYKFTTDEGEVIEYSVKVTNHFTNLPVVYVDTNTGVYITDDLTSKTQWKSARIQIVGNDEFDGLEPTSLEIRARGNTTLGWPKKAFNMKFEKQAKILGMPKHKRWVMIANYCDATLIRNDVAYYASGLTSLKWAPRGHFVELVYNGEYVGNYYLCEHVRVDKDRVAITETPQGDTSAENTGYLVEYDFHYSSTSKPYWTSYINTQQQTDWNNRGNSSVRYLSKYPDENDLSDAQYNYIKNYIRNFEIEIRDKLTENASTAEKEYKEIIEKYIEPVSFVDYWLVYEVCLNHELMNPGSVFVHKDVEGGVAGGKLIAGPTWDFDYGTFNFDYTDAGWYPVETKKTQLYLKTAIWYKYLFKNAKMKALAKERWATLKPSFETLPDYIRQQGAYLSESANENFNVWLRSSMPNLNYDINVSYEEAIEKMAKVIETRVANMDKAMKAW